MVWKKESRNCYKKCSEKCEHTKWMQSEILRDLSVQQITHAYTEQNPTSKWLEQEIHEENWVLCVCVCANNEELNSFSSFSPSLSLSYKTQNCCERALTNTHYFSFRTVRFAKLDEFQNGANKFTVFRTMNWSAMYMGHTKEWNDDGVPVTTVCGKDVAAATAKNWPSASLDDAIHSPSLEVWMCMKFILCREQNAKCSLCARHACAWIHNK